ncbi:MAG: hypothetical protein ABIQ51_08030, partial [Mesorhizobium sp.]
AGHQADAQQLWVGSRYEQKKSPPAGRQWAWNKKLETSLPEQQGRLAQRAPVQRALQPWVPQPLCSRRFLYLRVCL